MLSTNINFINFKIRKNKKINKQLNSILKENDT